MATANLTTSSVLQGRNSVPPNSRSPSALPHCSSLCPCEPDPPTLPVSGIPQFVLLGGTGRPHSGFVRVLTGVRISLLLKAQWYAYTRFVYLFLQTELWQKIKERRCISKYDLSGERIASFPPIIERFLRTKTFALRRDSYIFFLLLDWYFEKS